MRKDGTERCTVRVELHVPRELCSFIRTHEKLGEIETLFVIKAISHDLDEWHTLMYLPNENNELVRHIMSKDDVHYYENETDRAIIYDGPDLAWS